MSATRSSGWRQRWWGQLMVFGLIGVLSNLLGLALYWALTRAGLDPKLTVCVLYPVGAFVGFLGNRQQTFRHDGNTWVAGARYALVHAGGFVINVSMLYVLSDLAGFHHFGVQVLAVLVVALYLFIAMKYFVFPVAVTRAADTL